MNLSFKFSTIHQEKGAAAVELALLLPLLTLILFGILLFGLIFNNYLEITHAAREGVRWASLRAPEADIKSKAIDAAAGINLTVDDVQVTLGEATGTPLPADWPDESYQNQPVQVTVSYNVTEIKDLFGPFALIFPPDTITSSAIQRVE